MGTGLMAKKSRHIGFKGAERKVEREGYSEKTAAKIVASTAHNASAKAKRSNPRLKKV